MIGLFITATDLKKGTIIDGSVDDDILTPFIETAQVFHIQNYTGSKLYNRLSDGIIAGDLNPDEEYLLDNFISDAMINYTIADYLPFSAFKIKAGGTYAHTSDNALVASSAELDKLSAKYKERGEYYAKRLVEYLCKESAKYPEYTEAQTAPDITPDTSVDYAGGFYLGNSI